MTPDNDEDDEGEVLSQTELDNIVRGVIGTLTLCALKCRNQITTDFDLTEKDAAVIVSQLAQFLSENMIDALNQAYPDWKPLLEKVRQPTH